MKALIISDIHIAETTSIISGAGEVYTANLDQSIKGLNYYNDYAVSHNCDVMIVAGDMFNSATVSDKEITAVKSVKWNSIPKYFLVGNHESSANSGLRYNVTKMLATETSNVIDMQGFSLMAGNTQIHFLPYILHSDKQPLDTYLIKNKEATKHIIISHNDIAGIQYGGFISKDGFTIEEIDANCDLFLNGHLHNGGWFSKKGLNLGSYSCFNFTNDAFNYKYGGWILDTDTLELEFINNPYAWLFYKFEVKTLDELNKVLDKLGNNSAVSVKAPNSIIKDIRDILHANDKIITYKVCVSHDASDVPTSDIKELQSVDHINEFIKCCNDNIEDPENVLESELMEICK